MVANSTAVGSRTGGLSLVEEGGPSPSEVAAVPGEAAVSPWGRFAGIAVAVLMVAIVPTSRSLTFSPKYAVVLVIAAVGLVPFLRSVRLSRSGLPSLFLLGFLLVALLSSLTSVSPTLSLMGLYTWGTGWLLWLGCAGAYGVGLKLRSRGDREWLFFGLLAGAGVNALLALYQTLGHPTSTAFGPYQGNQAQGLVGNPIYLEALLLGTIALVLVRSTRSVSASWRYSPVLFLMAMALEFSDERFAVILLPFLLVGVLAWRRTTTALVAVISVVAGYLAGYLAAGSDLAGRLAEGTSSVGFGDRLRIWRIAGHAFLARPVLGYGPGLFEQATVSRMTARLARDLGPASLFTDGHDILVEVAVTTGILGLVLFAGWLLGALSSLRSSFGLFALCALAVELVEPLSLAITPLVFLLLAAGQHRAAAAHRVADAPEAVESPLPVSLRLMTASLLVLALGLGTTLVLGDVYLGKSPPDGYVLLDAQRAESMLPWWPQSAEALGSYYTYEADITPSSSATHREDLRRAVAQFELATRRDPFGPLVRAVLGNAEAQFGAWRSAIRTYRRGLRDDPWSQVNMQGIAAAYAHLHEWKAATATYRRELLALRPGFERTLAERALRLVEHHRLPPGPLS